MTELVGQAQRITAKDLPSREREPAQCAPWRCAATGLAGKDVRKAAGASLRPLSYAEMRLQQALAFALLIGPFEGGRVEGAESSSYIQFGDHSRLYASCTFKPALERISGSRSFTAGNEDEQEVTAWLSGLSPEKAKKAEKNRKKPSWT